MVRTGRGKPTGKDVEVGRTGKRKIDDSSIIPRLESVRYDMLCDLMTRARAAWRGREMWSNEGPGNLQHETRVRTKLRVFSLEAHFVQ